MLLKLRTHKKIPDEIKKAEEAQINYMKLGRTKKTQSKLVRHKNNRVEIGRTKKSRLKFDAHLNGAKLRTHI